MNAPGARRRGEGS